MNNLATVQTSIFAALDALPKTYPVYDAVPQGVAKPYIVIGGWSADPGEELQAMTTDASVEIDTWSTQNGKSQTHAMQEFVRARLDGQTIAGSWLVTEDFASILEDPSSTASARIYHGVQRFRVRV